MTVDPIAAAGQYATRILAVPTTRVLRRVPEPWTPPIPRVVGSMLPGLPAKLAKARSELEKVRQESERVLAPLVSAVQRVASGDRRSLGDQLARLDIERNKWFGRQREAELAVARIWADIRESKVAGEHQRAARRTERQIAELGLTEETRLVPFGARPKAGERLKPQPEPEPPDAHAEFMKAAMRYLEESGSESGSSPRHDSPRLAQGVSGPAPITPNP